MARGRLAAARPGARARGVVLPRGARARAHRCRGEGPLAERRAAVRHRWRQISAAGVAQVIMIDGPILPLVKLPKEVAVLPGGARDCVQRGRILGPAAEGLAAVRHRWRQVSATGVAQVTMTDGPILPLSRTVVLLGGARARFHRGRGEGPPAEGLAAVRPHSWRRVSAVGLNR